MAWDDGRAGDHKIYVKRLSVSGESLGPEKLVTLSTGDFRLPSLVRSADGYGLAYRGGNDLYFRRLDANGGGRAGRDRGGTE